MWQTLLGGSLPDPGWFAAPSVDARHGVELRYLGTAGFVLSAGGRTVVIDPYVSRVPLHALWRPLVPDEATLARVVPHADDVLVGHAHYDHVLDAPVLCRQTGARLIGSRAVANVGRAFGLPEAQLCETSGEREVVSGEFRMRGLPSRHGKVFMGRVLFPGDIEAPPAWPPHISALRHGLVLNWRVEFGGFRMVHIDSADFIPSELAGTQADVLCLCAAGWRARPRYVAEAISLLRPRYVVPCHWDTMITPIDEPARLLPGLRMDQMLEQIRAAGALPVMLPLLGVQRF